MKLYCVVLYYFLFLLCFLILVFHVPVSNGIFMRDFGHDSFLHVFNFLFPTCLFFSSFLFFRSCLFLHFFVLFFILVLLCFVDIFCCRIFHPFSSLFSSCSFFSISFFLIFPFSFFGFLLVHIFPFSSSLLIMRFVTQSFIFFLFNLFLFSDRCGCVFYRYLFSCS